METHLSDSKSSWENSEISQFRMSDLDVLLRKGAYVLCFGGNPLILVGRLRRWFG